MRESLFVRALSWEEEYRLHHKVRGRNLFVLRRAQIILASARGQRCGEISRLVGCSVSQVRTVIRLFNEKGEACLVRGCHRPKSAAPLLDESACEALRHLLHQSPRLFGCSSSLWSVSRLAQVAYQEGITPHRVGEETVRRALKRMGVNWKRAKRWITSPDPQYEAKKNAVTG